MTARTCSDLNEIRGWLLVCVLILVPHAVGATLALLFLDHSALGGTLGLVTLVVIAVGNLSGIFLVLSRSRIAPVFFTVYPVFLLVLTLPDSDLLGTANARLAAAGATSGVGVVSLAILLAVNVAIVTLMVGYWVKSEQVFSAAAASRPRVDTLARIPGGAGSGTKPAASRAVEERSPR